MYKRRRKSFLALVLCLVLVASVWGCGSESENNVATETVETETTMAENSNVKETEIQSETEPETESEVETKAEEVVETVESETFEEEEEPEIEYFEAYPSLNEQALWSGFSMGTCMSYQNMGYSAYKDMCAWHFGSLSATNEMKAYSLLDQAKSKKSPNGMPVMNYEKADEIVAFAQENGMGVRGHVLVWDASMSDWFFREGYNSNGAYVDKATMKARLQYYIEEVMTHFEEKFPGVVYCWDVVNEAVGDNESDYAAGDARHVRTLRSGKENLFYKYVGEDYVELSFLYARNTVEKLQKKNPAVDIKLFYNDYSTFYDAKRDAICELLKSVNSYAKDDKGNYRKLCDGMGMQSYIGGYGKQSGCMNSGDLAKVEKAIQIYADLGLEVHVTELAVRNYKDDEETLKKHGEFYGKLFEIYKNANADGKKVVTNVTIWGIQDNPYMETTEYSYRMSGPYCGLFDKSLCVKSAFRNVYEVLSEQ
ncbi:MAG: endo-1,4-beta-xylanase [Lachnospiraceae bacterium]|nr:endo-1,4-beta-xylanase [Lachnospiraceae bacterium]